MNKKRVAFFMFDRNNLDGGGGAERFWSDVFEFYNPENFRTYFLTDRKTFNELKRINRLRSVDQNENLIFIRDFKYLFLKNIIDSLFFVYKCLINRLDIVHICFYGPQYYKRLRFLQLLPKNFRPKISITIVSCFTPYCFQNESYEKEYGMKNRFNDLFNNIKLSGILSWYENFKKLSDNNDIIKSKPFVYAVKHCFTDLSKFKSSKEKKNIIVFAARFVNVKNPIFFIEAINIITKNYTNVLDNWKVVLYGKGPLEKEIKKTLNKYNLKKIVDVDYKSDMSSVFASSKIFVSSQDLENFTSLSMLEAMASGNIIIARNVGQTHFFVKNNANGFLCNENNPSDMAMKIVKAIESSKNGSLLANKSIEITKRIHNKENFFKELDHFFSNALKIK